jgi:signal recognition particle subunit SRP54
MDDNFGLEDVRYQCSRLPVHIRGSFLDRLFGSALPASVPAEVVTVTKRIQGVIDAMTPQERSDPDIIDADRCRRIAIGSGVAPKDVWSLLNQVKQCREMMRQRRKMSLWQRIKFAFGLDQKVMPRKTALQRTLEKRRE